MERLYNNICCKRLEEEAAWGKGIKALRDFIAEHNKGKVLAVAKRVRAMRSLDLAPSYKETHYLANYT